MTDGQRRAPLYEQLVRHRERAPASFHVPGHKSGRGLDPAASGLFRDIMSIDLTEIPGLDDLHQPEEAILEAQRLAARCFGAEETMFLIGGSTVGNLAMILSVCSRGDVLLVQRDAHKSVIHALMLAGAKAVFLMPRIGPRGVACGLAVEDIAEALKTYPEAKGLLMTNPSYYGIGVDLKPIADLLHQHGKVLLVDEAHGAHFGLHRELPASAMASGADAAVQSTHKMLTSMTMTAMLHVRGPRMPRGALKRLLAMLQSSSPSYPLLASLDVARRQMALQGEALLGQALSAAGLLRKRIGSLSRLRCLHAAEAGSPFPADCTYDPLKILIYDRAGTGDGYRLKAELEQAGCFPELADPAHVLLVLGPGSREADIERLAAALRGIDGRLPSGSASACNPSGPAEAPLRLLPDMAAMSAPVAFDLSLASQAPERWVSVAECEGYTAAQMIVPYPPGIPLLYPGETITRPVAELLARLADSGCRFHGHDVAKERTVPVSGRAPV